MASCLLGAGCMGLPTLSGDDVPSENVMPALASPSFTEDSPASAELLKGLDPEDRAVHEVYEAANRGVVNITSLSVGYNWLLQPVPQGGTGSGSILDQQGNVLTNYHVIKGAARLIVTLYDGQNFEAQPVGVDPENDLAVVRFNPAGRQLNPVPLGVSRDLLVGQKVIALGNPFGLQRTLTVGVVSSLHRPLQTPEGFLMRDLIQTDAAINPGNSGGPLLDVRGTMVGISTLILSPAGGNIGIGFAVPVDTARRVVGDILSYGEVRRGWIDIDPVSIFPALARRADLPVTKGVLISRVAPGGNADRAGLRGGDPSRTLVVGGRLVYLGGDIIVSIGGLPTWTPIDILGALESTHPGQTVQMEIIRDGKKIQVPVVLGRRPSAGR